MISHYRMKHFKIIIDVCYDEETVPIGMDQHLKDNVTRCVENHELLNDSDLQAIVSEWESRIEAED